MKGPKKYKVCIKDFKTHFMVGIYPHEKIEKQLLKINIEIDINIQKLTKQGHTWNNDNYKYILCYEEISNLILDLANIEQFNLVETVGIKIANKIFEIDKYDQISEIYISIDKPDAINSAKYAGIKMNFLK